MLGSHCPNCGSSDFAAANLPMRRMPRRYYLVRCGNCGESMTVVDSLQAIDLYRRGNLEMKKVFGEIIRRAVPPAQVGETAGPSA